MKTPLVTVGVPVYNGEKVIGRALEALLAQDYESVEIVISDNASTDGTLDVCRDYAARDRRIRVIAQAANLGASRNFESLLAEARGEYFVWAGCDDWWAPSFVSRLVAALEQRREAGVAMCAVRRMRSDGELVDEVRFPALDAAMMLPPRRVAWRMARGVPYHLFIYGLYRTAFLRRAFGGFPPVYAGDRLFMCRVALSTHFAYVDEILHVRNVHVEPVAKRYAQEQLGRSHRDRWRYVRSATAAVPYLLRSRTIPPGRWPLVPLIGARFSLFMMMLHVITLLQPLARRTLPERVRHSLVRRLP